MADHGLRPVAAPLSRPHGGKELNVRGGSQGPDRRSAAGSRGSGATNADKATMAASAVAGDGGGCGVERKRNGGMTKYYGCSDVTTPQSFARGRQQQRWLAMANAVE